MSILVCGGAGYIGSHNVRALLARGEEPVVIDNFLTGHRQAVPGGVRLYQGDIRDPAALDRVFAENRIEAVLHFAASSLVGVSMEKPLPYFNNNVHGMQTLLEAMLRHGVDKIVFSSTAAVYGEERVLYGFIIGISSIHEKNQIRCPVEGRIVFGEKDNKKTDRVKAVEELFTKAKIESEVPENIHLEQWKKFLLNVVFNTLSALCRAPYGAFSAPVMRDLARSVGREVIAVAQAEGVPLTQAIFEDTLSLIIGLDAHGKTSMLQDFEAGRKSENAWFCGTVNKLGKAHGIPTPVCTLLEALVEGTEIARGI